MEQTDSWEHLRSRHAIEAVRAYQRRTDGVLEMARGDDGGRSHDGPCAERQGRIRAKEYLVGTARCSG